MVERDQNTCEYCGEALEGRVDKRFCNPSCKSAFHYERSKENGKSLFQKIDEALKTNRRILKNFNKAGKSTVRAEILETAGFKPYLHTHKWKATNGNIYYFCYEFGYYLKKENNRMKYVLVQWQDYMNRQTDINA